jgi:hypothetical protein
MALAGGICLMWGKAGANSIYEIGTADPGTPASENDETSFLNQLLKMYNTGSPGSPFDNGHNVFTLNVGSAVPSPILATVANGDNKGQVLPRGNGPSTGLQINLSGLSFKPTYAMVKWGQDSEFYYIGGLTGTITLNNDINKNGESHYDLWTGESPQVPDGGMTVVLLGAALSGLALIRRQMV